MRQGNSFRSTDEGMGEGCPIRVTKWKSDGWPNCLIGTARTMLDFTKL